MLWLVALFSSLLILLKNGFFSSLVVDGWVLGWVSYFSMNFLISGFLILFMVCGFMLDVIFLYILVMLSYSLYGNLSVIILSKYILNE